MDGNFGLDLNAVFQHIGKAQTFSIFFPTLRRALVVDMRHAPAEGPLVRVMPMARSASERLRTLKRMRPHLPRASEIVAIPWPAYVNNLVSSGVWEKILARIDESGSTDARHAIDNALDELRRIERHEIAALIRGEQYETIWAKQD